MSYITTSDLTSYLGVVSTASSTTLQPYVDAAQAEIEAFCKRSFEQSTGTRYYRSDDLQYMPLSGSPSYLGTAVGGIGALGYGLDSGRTYQSNIYSRRVLDLGKDLLALGGLTNGDGTTMASTDVWLEPRNQTPYRIIRLKSAESWSFGTDGEITVSGTWGYSTGPAADIIEYTKEVAAYLYRLKDAQVFDVVADPASGTITVPKGMPAHVKQGLLNGGYVAGLKRRRVI